MGKERQGIRHDVGVLWNLFEIFYGTSNAELQVLRSTRLAGDTDQAKRDNFRRE